MQMKEAKRLREQFGKPCQNPSYEKEYYLGASTGDRVCSNCGFSPEAHEEKKEDKEIDNNQSLVE